VVWLHAVEVSTLVSMSLDCRDWVVVVRVAIADLNWSTALVIIIRRSASSFLIADNSVHSGFLLLVALWWCVLLWVLLVVPTV